MSRYRPQKGKDKIGNTGVQKNELIEISKKIHSLQENLKIHKTIKRIFENRHKSILEEKNGPPPEVNLFNEKNNGLTLLNLIEKNFIKSAHDVSLGGIITAISKMCIKGDKGIQIKKPKFLINEIEYFFAEDQGRYLIEINPKDLKEVSKILDKNSVHYDEIGKIIDKEMIIDQKTKLTIDELKSYNTNWLKSYMV